MRFRVVMFQRRLGCFCAAVPHNDLLLVQFAKRSTLATSRILEYLKAKEEFDGLIEKYQIFSTNQKSVADTAKMVGLQVPEKFEE